MCAEIGASYLIDDSIDYATECAAAGVPMLLFGPYAWNGGKAARATGGNEGAGAAAAGWDQGSSSGGGLPPRVVRALTWDDVLRRLM
jgi:hypothetical protein